MSRRLACVVTIVAAVALAGCGGGADTTSSAESTEAATSDITTTLAATPATDPPTTSTSSTTTTTTSSSTSTTSSTTTSSLPDEESCLEGSWWLSPEETTALYAALLPGIPVTVTGTHWVEFDGDRVDYWTLLEARFALGGTDVTFGIDQHGEGTYAVADDVLSITYDTYEATTHRGHGEAIYDRTQDPATYADEAVALTDNGNGTITIDGVTVPALEIPPVAGGPVGCDADTMSLGFTSGLADAAGVFVRNG